MEMYKQDFLKKKKKKKTTDKTLVASHRTSTKGSFLILATRLEDVTHVDLKLIIVVVDDDYRCRGL